MLFSSTAPGYGNVDAEKSYHSASVTSEEVASVEAHDGNYVKSVVST